MPVLNRNVNLIHMWNHQNYTIYMLSLIRTYFVLTRQWDTEQSSSIVFISLLNAHTSYQQSLPSASWWTIKASKELELSLYFYGFIFSWKWLANREQKYRKDMRGFLGHSSFLEHHFLLSEVKASFGFKAVNAPNLSRHKILCYTLRLVGLPSEFCTPGASWTLYANEQQETGDMHIHTALLHSHTASIVPSDFTYKTQVQM